MAHSHIRRGLGVAALAAISTAGVGVTAAGADTPSQPSIAVSGTDHYVNTAYTLTIALYPAVAGNQHEICFHDNTELTSSGLATLIGGACNFLPTDTTATSSSVTWVPTQPGTHSLVAEDTANQTIYVAKVDVASGAPTTTPSPTTTTQPGGGTGSAATGSAGTLIGSVLKGLLGSS